jgi:hypothetical protein
MKERVNNNVARQNNEMADKNINTNIGKQYFLRA